MKLLASKFNEKSFFSDLSCTHVRTCVYGRYAPALLLFLGLEHDILFPIGAASEPQSTMGRKSIVNSRYGSIHRGYCRRYCVVLLFFGLITGAQPKAGTGLKMQTVRFFNVTLLGIYRWLIEILAAILKSTRHGGQSRERL